MSANLSWKIHDEKTLLMIIRFTEVGIISKKEAKALIFDTIYQP